MRQCALVKLTVYVVLVRGTSETVCLAKLTVYAVLVPGTSDTVCPS